MWGGVEIVADYQYILYINPFLEILTVSLRFILSFRFLQSKNNIGKIKEIVKHSCGNFNCIQNKTRNTSNFNFITNYTRN
jgi:hypothetical protein